MVGISASFSRPDEPPPRSSRSAAGFQPSPAPLPGRPSAPRVTPSRTPASVPQRSTSSTPVALATRAISPARQQTAWSEVVCGRRHLGIRRHVDRDHRRDDARHRPSWLGRTHRFCHCDDRPEHRGADCCRAARTHSRRARPGVNRTSSPVADGPTHRGSQPPGLRRRRRGVVRNTIR